MSFDFAHSFCIQFRVSWYITGLNRTSEEKFIVIRIFLVLLFSISSVLIYEGTQSDIRVKFYCPLNLLRAFVFNFEHLDILRDSIGHLSEKLLSFEFAQSFHIQFRVSRDITGLNRTSDKKSYSRLNLLKASIFNFECLDILQKSIGYSRKK